jgi:osmotically-inducible protein OsmY
MTRADMDIKRDIESQLRNDASVDAGDIRVEVKNGRVNLTGIVTDYEAYQSVLRDAWMIHGVAAVMDQLRIEYPVGTQAPADTELRNRILNIFEWSSAINARNIDVEVSDGIVDLDGAVDVFWQIKRAEDLAYTVAGVIRVNNNIVVSAEESFADDTVRQDLLDSFRRVLYLDADKIDVTVRSGIAVLYGTVPDWFAFRTASDVACHQKGIRGLVNNIEIRETVGTEAR